MSNLPRRLRVGSIASSAVLGAVIWFGCTDAPQAPLPPDAQTNRASQGVDRLQELDLGPALEAQARHGAALMRIPGVVGHGIGLDEDGNANVTVFTLHPDVSGVPARVDGVATRSVASGMFVVGQTTSRARPAPNGYSVGHPDITAGTLGAIVQDGGGACYILSNNHVLANSNEANIGDSALQPGPFDGGSDPADAIGTLFDFETIAFDGSSNTIDAAIALLFDKNDVTAQTPGSAYGAPGTSPTSASPNQSVQKFGRTTEHTTGTVDATNVTVDVCYEARGPFRCVKVARFTGQFTIGPGSFSDGGDSGSLIVTNDGNKRPVGLLFAGSSTRTIANPIGPVLNAFTVSVIADASACTNGGSPPPPPPPPPPPGGVTVSSIVPDAIAAGATVQVTVAGSGFASGATLSLENGKGPNPTAANASVSGDGTSLTADVSAASNGPKGSSAFDVRVTNPDGSSGVLSQAFTVTR